jgi:ectoine hydroxylase-related dioxygenase (phytanoyl-CoA dioxygenase family)
MTKSNGVPEHVYGVLQQDRFESGQDEVAEQVRRLGYAVLDSGYTPAQLREISDAFDRVRERYVNTWGETRLRSLNEFHTIRALLTHGGATFMQLAMNPSLMTLLQKLIVGKFILNQQNGVINPPGETYNQGAWHRDLPYQHYVSSSPLAVNALFCVDDFTFENGSTFVLPASHKAIAFPSESYLRNNAVQVEAKAGQYLLLDCMLFHSGGFNRTAKERRAVNHVYNIPYFKQQINLPKNMSDYALSVEARELLGFNYQEPASIEQYLASRSKKVGV